MSGRLLRLAVVASCVMLSAPLLAQGKKPAPAKKPAAPPAVPDKPAEPVVHASALVHLATELAKSLGTISAGTVVVVSPLASDLPAPKGDELSVRFASQLAGRLNAARAHPQASTLSVARGISGRASSLVFVQLEIVKGELRATGDLYPVVRNSWERLANPVPEPQAHAFAATSIDAEVRTFLGAVLLEQAQVHKIKHEEGEVVAVGCGDVDGDGGLELVLVSRSRVNVARVRGGKLASVLFAPWSQIAARAPVPFREPIGTVVISPRGHRGEVFLGTTDRGGVVTDARLSPRRALAGLPVAGDVLACALPSPEASALDGALAACHAPERPAVKDARGATVAPLLEMPASKFDAGYTFDAVAKNGSIESLVAAREPSGKLHVRRSTEGGKVSEFTVDGVGAQVALADLDLDGVPELVTTDGGSGDDAIVISSVARTEPVVRMKLSAKEGVRALGVCPPEERGVPGLVAVVGNEVWLVR